MKFWTYLFIFCLFQTMLWAQEMNRSKTEVSSVYGQSGTFMEGTWTGDSVQQKFVFGMYITDLFNLSWHNESFDAAFWAWFRHSDPNVRPTLGLEVVNSMYTHLDFPSMIDIGNGEYWSCAKYRVGVSQDWNLSDFPFVSQVLQIWIENAHIDLSQAELVVDKANSGIDPGVWLPGWIIQEFDIYSVLKTYNTNFGASFRGENVSQFSRVICEIKLQSDSSRKFFKIFGVMYLSFFLALCVFFVPPGELNSKMGLVIASVFAAIGNKFVLDSYLPPIGSLNLVNKLELLTFSCLGITAVMAIVTAWLHRRHHFKLSRAFELFTAGILLCVYVILNCLWISWAVQGISQ